MINNLPNHKSLHSAISGEQRYAFTPRNIRFYDGIQNNARVEGTTIQKLYTKIVDQVLVSPTYTSRLMGGGKPFEGRTMDITLDVLADTQGQWFTGLETLNTAAVSTTVTTSYAHTAFTQPVVSVMLESFANVGSLGIINLDTFKYEKAAAQALQSIGSAAYGIGTANQMLGLEAIVDDGTNVATIGGVSRSTYPQLDSYVAAASGGKLTLAFMATLEDNARAAGLSNERPNIMLGKKDIFSWYEQLLSPNVWASYNEVGYDKLRLKKKYAERNTNELRNSAGFSGLSYRMGTLIDDDFGVDGNLYMLNEEYANYYGRSEVPEEYKEVVEHVDFGDFTAYEGTGAMAVEEMPSEYHGWYWMKRQVIPNQAGSIGRFFVIGQYICDSFRRQSKGTDITGV